MLDEFKYNFLNEQKSVLNKKDWNNPESSLLWLYNLHYFDDLNAIDSSTRNDWHKAAIKKWIDENEPAIGVGWQPYPLSIRIVNWIKWIISENNTEDTYLQSLAIQIRYLRKKLEYHLLGNHLLSNAKALVFSGLFFEGSEADAWLLTGNKILEKEIKEQFLNDGGHFELSPMYHSQVLEDLLDIVNIYRCYKKEEPEYLIKNIPAAIFWLQSMLHSDGEITFFNDAATGIAPDPDEIFRYAQDLGFEKKKDFENICDLDDSGYLRVQKENMLAILDVGKIGPDYLPGHSHADTLSFELSLYGNRVIVNSGISEYAIGEERSRQRGTKAHSTIEIDGKNSSEVWAGFRVARRAYPLKKNIIIDDNKIIINACHNGYQRLSGKPVHCRTWEIKTGSLIIKDTVKGKGLHSLISSFHIHPDIGIIKKEENKYILQDKNNNQIFLTYHGKGEMALLKSSYHYKFGISMTNSVLRSEYTTELPEQTEIELTWY